jgi:hypothetical protein
VCDIDIVFTPKYAYSYPNGPLGDYVRLETELISYNITLTNSNPPYVVNLNRRSRNKTFHHDGTLYVTGGWFDTSFSLGIGVNEQNQPLFNDSGTNVYENSEYSITVF